MLVFRDETCNLGNFHKPCDTPSILSRLKLNRLAIGHLNINSLPGKLDHVKSSN